MQRRCWGKKRKKRKVNRAEVNVTKCTCKNLQKDRPKTRKVANERVDHPDLWPHYESKCITPLLTNALSLHWLVHRVTILEHAFQYRDEKCFIHWSFFFPSSLQDRCLLQRLPPQEVPDYGWTDGLEPICYLGIGGKGTSVREADSADP